MAALVAFYLAEFAPPEERKYEISSEDIAQYFKQAGFPLPQKVQKTLANALMSGYVTKTSFGKYKLSPVGYNLVAHKLGSSSTFNGSPSRKKSAKKNKK